MNANEPILVTLPDGSEREVRWCAGASRLVRKHIGQKPISDMGDDEMVEAIYYMMYDDKGKPPPLSLDEWLYSTPLDPNSTKELATVFIAATQGLEKKRVQEALLGKTPDQSTGSEPTPAPTITSDSAAESSGGDTPSQNSTASSPSGENNTNSIDTAQVQLPPLS